jgi:HPt (histidine-containing phosphotransfer) domain-containing protein
MSKPMFSEGSLQKSLRSADSRLHYRVLKLFVANLDELSETLTNTPDSLKQWQELATTAHRHKSPAESVGSEQLAATLDELENAIDCEQLTVAARILRGLPSLVDQTKNVIDQKIGLLEQEL